MAETEVVTVKTPRQEVAFRVSKVIKVDVGKEGKPFLYFDQLKDGTWRVTYTEGTLKTIEVPK